jgi:hypothetical protein
MVMMFGQGFDSPQLHRNIDNYMVVVITFHFLSVLEKLSLVLNDTGLFFYNAVFLKETKGASWGTIGAGRPM